MIRLSCLPIREWHSLNRYSAEERTRNIRECAIRKSVYTTNKSFYQAHVPVSLTKSIKATEWIQVVSDYLGGRFGGGDGQAMGAADISDKSLEDGKTLLERYAKIKLDQ